MNYMGDQMTFPATFDEFAEQYKIVDKQEVYTNGTELIPIFRVKQWLDHSKNEVEKIFKEMDGITELFIKGLIGELEMYDQLAELKKKYTEGDI